MAQSIEGEFRGRIATVRSWEEFQNRLYAFRKSSFIYRGVREESHVLVPQVGRSEIFGEYSKEYEKRIVAEFRYRVGSQLAMRPADDWDWLAFAQHCGVPTRLLDWSTSPLIATFFALDSERDSDRYLICCDMPKYAREAERSQSPFEVDLVYRFSPPLFVDRLRNQRGVFTIHPNPCDPFRDDRMRIIKIPRELLEGFQATLFYFGIDYAFLYPDPEGYGRQLRWQYKNKIGIGSDAER